MNTLKRAVGMFVMLCCMPDTVLTASNPECGEHVSLDTLIANPDTYHGEAVWVRAHVTIDFENMTACPSENETQDKYKSCLWLNIDDGPYKTDQDYARYQSKLKIWKQFNLQTVAIRATFDKTSKGHFSMWPGTLRGVTEMSGHQGGWNFISNAAVPRTVCVGELPAPKETSGRYAGLGILKFKSAEYDGAIADFTRAIKLEPGNSGYYILRGNAKRVKRDYPGAIADYTSAIKFGQEYREVLYIHRAEVKEQAGDLDGAIADYTRAIKINPKDAGTYRGRGLAKQKKGDTQGAAADLARAKQLAP